jgi:S1-C subfamily serine protease
MDEQNNSKKQTGTTQAGQQPLTSCSKSFKPWILTLFLLALLTLGWVVYESWREGGIAKHLFGGVETGDMTGEQDYTGNYYNYNAVNLPMVNTMQDSYHTIIDHVRPAVVSIDVAVITLADVQGNNLNPLLNPAAGGNGMNPVAGTPVTNYTRVGSGVIIDDKGYVLTSYHVVENAAAIKATVFGPGGAFDYPLKLVNVDRTTDLALLRLLGNGSFPHAVLGDSDMVRTGDVVLAMGSPFGFDQTITTGIISSRNRTVTIGGKVLEGMLQTDTPINQGNSGGPLVNARGEVIAINTAIFSPNGAFSGIGFAIPVNQAFSLVGGVVDFGGAPPQVAGGQLAAWARMGRQSGNTFKLPNGQIINAPHVYRGQCLDCHPQLCATPGQGGGRGFAMGPGNGMGIQRNNTSPVAGQGAVISDSYLGATLLDVDDLIAKQFKLAHAGGVLVDRVMPGSPAEAAGLQRGDIILRLDGRKIQDVNELQKMLGAKKPGAAAELTMMSNGSRKTLKVRFAQTPAGAPSLFAQAPQPRQPGEFEWLGAEITPLSPVILAYVKEGVYVAEAGGVIGAAGVLKGDVIKSVNNHAVADMISFIKIAQKVNVKDGILLDIIRSGNPLYITVKG